MLKTLVIGHLGKDATVNNVNGRNVINFTIAHTERFKDAQGNQQERTTWVECSYWTDRTAVAPYLQKGTQVYAEGIPEVRTFTRNDRSTGASLALRVQNVQLLGAKREGSQPGNYQTGQMAPQQHVPQGQQRSNFPQDPANNWGNMSNEQPADDLPF